MAQARVSEKVVQAGIVKLLRSVRGQVYVLGTHRRRGDWPGTMQTPGIPDVMAFLPPPSCMSGPWTLLCVECKAKSGRLREAQQTFRDLCINANVWHVVGGIDAVITWLTARGYLREVRR